MHVIPAIRRVGQHAAIYSIVRQQLLSETLNELGDYRWDIDIPHRRLDFTSAKGQISATADVIASIAVSPTTILWGWADLFAPYVGPDPQARRIAEFGQRHNLAALCQEEVPYLVAEGENPVDAAAMLAHDIGSLAVEVFGPDALYYSGPTGGAGSRQVFLLRDLSAQVPVPSLQDVLVRIPTLVGGGIDDLPWSLDGLVHLMPGWHMDRTQEGTTDLCTLRVPDGTSATIRIEHDDLGRVGQVSTTVPPPGS